ncbi:RNA polymerase subunit sigma [Luteimonas chenhongjianii]|uniref:RNA polymerase subunit sigma n=1 Tax=Luteimonas chenhongjianii TaxID=2006110 RepID=A0A290XFP2_9GAMM|nr:RNA polymerase subunit sigma [Luteimonas chenhongjianii]ATD67838.1 RNA polymerase subunit sigma [Luteimonas chenhongjianii]
MPEIASQQDASGDDALMQARVEGDVLAFETTCRRHRDKRHPRSGRLVDEVPRDVPQRGPTLRACWRPEPLFTARPCRIVHTRLAGHRGAAQERPPPPDDTGLRTARLVDPGSAGRRLSESGPDRQLQLALESLPAAPRVVEELRLLAAFALEEIGVVTGAGREPLKACPRHAVEKLRMLLTP